MNDIRGRRKEKMLEFLNNNTHTHTHIKHASKLTWQPFINNTYSPFHPFQCVPHQSTKCETKAKHDQLFNALIMLCTIIHSDRHLHPWLEWSGNWLYRQECWPKYCSKTTGCMRLMKHFDTLQHILSDRFYIVPSSASEQTHCTLVACKSEWL